MDLYTCVYFLTLFSTPLIAYLLLFKDNNHRKDLPDWYYPIKYCIAKYTLKKKRRSNKCVYSEEPKKLQTEKEHDYHSIYGNDQNGNCLIVKICLRKHRLAESTIFLKLSDGNVYTLPESPEITLSSTITEYELKASGLEIQILEPFKRLRILYNGLLINNLDGCKHFRFNFIWTCAGQPIFYPEDASVNISADALARERWRDGNWFRLLPEESYYEQYGALKGTITTETFASEMNLASYRKHFRGISDVHTLYCDFSIFAVAEDGITFNLGSKSYSNGSCTQLKYGNMISNNGGIFPLEEHDLNLYDFIMMEGDLPKVFMVHFKVAKKTFRCVVNLNVCKAFVEQCSEENGWKIVRIPVECDLNDQQAKGVVTVWKHNRGLGKQQIPPILLTDINKRTCLLHFAKSLQDDYCKNLRFTGGKANSLALMTSLNCQDVFKVPPGIVVFVAAFKFQINKNNKILRAIEILESVAHGLIEGDLEESCQKTQEIISTTEIDETIKNCINVELQNVYNKYGAGQWAVRSSAIGEDGTELSAAGQNSTYLGCKTEEEILNAITKCWASPFSYKSVQYRRQHGLPIKCDLAVLIQKMVAPQSAGILFTCQPTTGNPQIIIITSNYGLGESVVSAKSEPDTITLKRNNGTIQITSQTIGSKTNMVVLNQNGGIETKTVTEDKRKLLSINEEEAVRLAHTGLYLEKCFGRPLDIEWAYENVATPTLTKHNQSSNCFQDQLFILQARPVTTLNAWNEIELKHEFDTAILSEEDTFLTKANIGEVMPGAVTALSKTIATFVSIAMEKTAGVDQSYLGDRAVSFQQHHAFLEFTNMFSKSYGENDVVTNTALDLSVFGHLVRTEEMASVVLKRYGTVSLLQRFKYFCETLKILWIARDTMQKAIETNKKINIIIQETDNAMVVHKKIQNYLNNVFAKLAVHHTIVSRASVIYQFIVMSILVGEGRFTPEHYHDISLLFSSHENVISAEIPKQLQLLAKAITQANLSEEFLTTNEPIEFLKQHSPLIYEQFEKFLLEQGHRALREFELEETSWGANPKQMIDFVKRNVQLKNFDNNSTKCLNVDETIAKLLTANSVVKRFLLKILVRKSRSAVARRESTKCELSRSVNKLRNAYSLLAKKLTTEGKIPNVHLIYHLSDYEIGQIILANNPILVKKALLRRRLYSQWNNLKFPEISHGIPQPDKTATITNKTTQEIKGTPVCMGEVEARACVITNVQDAVDQLQQGDILITYSTDIAWSLYFPMISGIVTELGGLISHGAVIAREFCLPCIVGSGNVTKLFKTGDIVYLSGTKGILRLVKSVDDATDQVALHADAH